MLAGDKLPQLQGAHRSFATRFANLDIAVSIDPARTPRSGDLCVATVTRLGHHRHVELVSGRRAALTVGDTLVLAFGNRYATDQFEAVVPETVRPCHLTAAGGLAAVVIGRHTSVKAPTEISPLGILCDASGTPLNLDRWIVMDARASGPQPHMILVVGSSMNAGKTTACANIIRTLRACGLRTTALKLTGTGSGGDLWRYLDSGACEAMDFASVGLASTAGMDVRALDSAITRLCAAVPPSTDVIVAELADGILQRETSHLLQESALRNRIGSLVFAGIDPLSAVAGVQLLASWGLEAAAVSGLLCASPLAVRELRSLMNTPVVFAENEDPHAVAACLFAPAITNVAIRHAS